MNSPLHKVLPPMGIRKKTFTITDWKTWDDGIDAAVRVFEAEFACTPEILVVSTATHFRIDLAAKNLHSEKFADIETGLVPDGPPDSGIGEFSGEIGYFREYFGTAFA